MDRLVELYQRRGNPDEAQRWKLLVEKYDPERRAEADDAAD